MITNYELRITNYDYVPCYELRVTSYELQMRDTVWAAGSGDVTVAVTLT